MISYTTPGMCDRKFIEHLVYRRARFDRQDRFIYVPCAKAMSGTIDVLLGLRGIHQKMGSGIYKKLKPQFRAAEYDEAVRRYRGLNRDDLFIFTFVRNPWDRVLSAVSYIRGKKFPGIGVKVPRRVTKEKFSAFVTGPLMEQGPDFHSDFRQQHSSFETDGSQFADLVGRHETFADEWPRVAERIGLPSRDSLPRARRSKHKDYRRYYTDAAIEAVASMYARDIEVLGYEF